MSAEDLEKYETEMELQLYREYRDVVGLFSHVVETERRFYLTNQVELNVRTAENGEVFFEVTMQDAWVWDMYRPARFVKNVRVVTFKDVNVEDLAGRELPDPQRALGAHVKQPATTSRPGYPHLPGPAAPVHRPRPPLAAHRRPRQASMAEVVAYARQGCLGRRGEQLAAEHLEARAACGSSPATGGARRARSTSWPRSAGARRLRGETRSGCGFGTPLEAITRGSSAGCGGWRSAG